MLPIPVFPNTLSLVPFMKWDKMPPLKSVRPPELNINFQGMCINIGLPSLMWTDV